MTKRMGQVAQGRRSWTWTRSRRYLSKDNQRESSSQKLIRHQRADDSSSASIGASASHCTYLNWIDSASQSLSFHLGKEAIMSKRRKSKKRSRLSMRLSKTVTLWCRFPWTNQQYIVASPWSNSSSNTTCLLKKATNWQKLTSHKFSWLKTSRNTNDSFSLATRP